MSSHPGRLFCAMASCLGGLVSWALADEPESEQRAENLRLMRTIAASVHVFGSPDRKGSETPLIPDPVLRYTDSTRWNSDASLWIWGDGGRPAAIVGIEHYPKRPREPRWLIEIASLSGERIVVGRGADLNWTARAAGADLSLLPGAGPIADQPTARMTEMKALQRRFTAYEKTPIEGRIELRSLTRPLYRYRDPHTGIIDGTIMSFANGTNPEVLLMLEAWDKTTGQPGWQFALIQISGGVVTAELDGKEIWTAPEADPPAVRDRYMNRWVEP